jgi:hypothetical protein
MRYYDSSNVLRNTRDDQFIASTAADTNKTGTYNCASGEPGIFLLYNPSWDTEENLGNDALLLGVSSMNPNNTVSGSNVTVLANSTNTYTLAPTVTMTANGTLQLVTNAFGSGKNAISTRFGASSTGMFSTTTSLTLGGSSDGAGVEFTIYFLGRGATFGNTSEVGLFSFGLPTATSRAVNYQAELTRYQVDSVGSVLVPGARSLVIGSAVSWLGQIGTRDANMYPKYQNTFEVWCVTKVAGTDSAEVYLNNQLLTTTSAPLWSENSITWAKRASGFWQLGDGATSVDRTSGTSTGTHVGAFQVYNKYHNYSARCGILRSLMNTFYIPPTASSGGITSTTLGGSITQNTRTSSFTISIADYPHRNVQSLKDYYVFFATSDAIPTNINIIENNVTAINTSISGTVTLTCTAVPIYTGTQALCLAIASPGSSNTTPATKILTYVGGTFTPTTITNTFQIEFWFAASTGNFNGFTTLVVRTADTDSNNWTTVYTYETGTTTWVDQANNLVTNAAYSTTPINTTNFCSSYNTIKFTTPPINVKRAVVVHLGNKSGGFYYAPNVTDGIRIKLNGTVYTTFADANAAGMSFRWVTTNSNSAATNFLNYLTKTDSTTDTTSPVVVNGETFVTWVVPQSYFTLGDSADGYAANNLPVPGQYQQSDITKQSCLRITFPK